MILETLKPLPSDEFGGNMCGVGHAFTHPITKEMRNPVNPVTTVMTTTCRSFEEVNRAPHGSMNMLKTFTCQAKAD